MAFELSAKQQAFVDEANRRAADAAKSGRAPSQHFIDKCNSEAGVEFARVQVPFVKDASQDIVRVMSNAELLTPMLVKRYRLLGKSKAMRKSGNVVETLVSAFSGIFTHR